MVFAYGNRALDGYRIGKIENIARDLAGNPDLASWTAKGFDPAAPRVLCGASGSGIVQPGAYYVYYDDNFDDYYFGYLAVVHAVTIFPDAPSEGASLPAGIIIIEYLEHCFPEWADFTSPLRPFFGVYYRVAARAADGAERDTVRMANPVDLAKLDEWSYANMPGSGGRLPAIYYAVETATLDEARAKFTAGTDAAFINWGVVMPQYRSAPSGE